MKLKLFMFYMADGHIQPLYGTSPMNALDNARWSLDYVTTNVRDWRENSVNDLEFINGKWESKETKNKIPIAEIHNN